MKTRNRFSCKAGFLLLALSLCFGLIGCSFDDNFCFSKVQAKDLSGRSIYSWNREFFEIDPEIIANELKCNDISVLYQGLYPSDFSNPELANVVKEFREREIETVYLVGDPDWKDSETVIFWALQPLVDFNNSVEKESQINRVCFDIEFFNSKTGTTFEEFTEMMKGIYEFCHSNYLDVIVCLPYWIPDVYGQYEFDCLLDSVDFLSCSVFLVDKEEELLQSTARICEQSKKPFEAILDLQPESVRYGVKSENTYYHRGLQSALISFERMEQRYGCCTSVHNLSEYRKMLEQND